MDAAFGSHSSQEDMDELCRIQQEIGLVDLLNRDQQFASDAKDGTTHKEVLVV